LCSIPIAGTAKDKTTCAGCVFEAAVIELHTGPAGQAYQPTALLQLAKPLIASSFDASADEARHDVTEVILPLFDAFIGTSQPGDGEPDAVWFDYIHFFIHPTFFFSKLTLFHLVFIAGQSALSQACSTSCCTLALRATNAKQCRAKSAVWFTFLGVVRCVFINNKLTLFLMWVFFWGD
jgi:hypothetical protein